MNTKNIQSENFRIAKVGDLVSFNANIHFKMVKSKKLNARVLKVFENSVMVDVRRIKLYKYEYTIVNHQNYILLDMK